MIENQYLNISNQFEKYKAIKTTKIFSSREKSSYVFSIIIPTYNRKALLMQAVDSAISQIGFDQYEILIVDNNPQRNTEVEQLIINQYQYVKNLSYFKNTDNLGMFGNWNRCFELALGEWVVMLHDDDLLKSDCLLTLNQAIRKEQTDGADIVGGRIEFLYDNMSLKLKIKSILLNMVCFLKNYLFKNIENITLDDLIMRNPIYQPGLAIRRSTVYAMNGFADQASFAEDYLFFIRSILAKKKIIYVNKSLAYYRWFENQSLTEECRYGFIRIAYLVRQPMIKLSKNKKIWSLYNKVFSYKQAKKLKKEFGRDQTKLTEEINIKLEEYLLYWLCWPFFFFKRIKFLNRTLISTKDGL